jgi:AcrR family transcriptional regulator
VPDPAELQDQPPGPARDTDTRSLDGRTALLESACRSIAQKGLRGLRVEEVASDAGVAASLIYHHFGDRAALLRAALEHVGQKAAAYTETDHEASGRDELKATLQAEIQDDPEVRDNSAAWGEFRDAAVFDESLRPTLFRYTREWIDDVADLLRRGQGDGSVARELDPEQVGQQLTALTEGLSTRWLASFLTTEQARNELLAGIERFLGPLPRVADSRVLESDSTASKSE